MFAKVTSLGLSGLAGYVVQVEADLSSGLPQFTLVGLPDSAVKESSERVRSAVKNLHYPWPSSRITINLAPADVRKTGPVYDLPLLVGLLAAQGVLPAARAASGLFGGTGPGWHAAPCDRRAAHGAGGCDPGRDRTVPSWQRMPPKLPRPQA